MSLSAGPAAPLGSFGEHRSLGIRAQASLFLAEDFFRVDVAGVFFNGNPEPRVSAWRTGDSRDLIIAGNLLAVLSRSETSVLRGLLGLSAHRMSIEDVPNPYGSVPGLQLGGMLEHSWRGQIVTIELGLHVVASDYGADEWSGSFSIPLLVGMKW